MDALKDKLGSYLEGYESSFHLLSSHLLLRGMVIKGFGRGSKELGIPTANLDVDALGESLNGVGAGIYCGFAYIDPSPEDVSNRQLLKQDAQEEHNNTTSNAGGEGGGSGGAISLVDERKEGKGTGKGLETNDDDNAIDKKDAVKFNATPDSKHEQCVKASTSPHPGKVYKMVMSIGWNPFFKNEKKTVEPYIIHDFGGQDFYGSKLSLVVTAFLRPELNYTTLENLINAIHKDIALSSALLDLETKRDDIDNLLFAKP
jgi:riboflavin kinase